MTDQELIGDFMLTCLASDIVEELEHRAELRSRPVNKN